MIAAVFALTCAVAGQAGPPPSSSDAPKAASGASRPWGPGIFAIVFRTGPAWDPAKRPVEQPYFAEHSHNLRNLRLEGRLLLGGRFSDQGLVLVRASTQEEAQAMVDRDPSVANGTFRAEVHPFSAFQPGCVGTEGAPK